jgi:hypothetical protein
MLSKLNQSSNVRDGNVYVFSNRCRTSISGSTVDLTDILGLRKLPADGMFASTTTDHEDLHFVPTSM